MAACLVFRSSVFKTWTPRGCVNSKYYAASTPYVRLTLTRATWPPSDRRPTDDNRLRPFDDGRPRQSLPLSVFVYACVLGTLIGCWLMTQIQSRRLASPVLCPTFIIRVTLSTAELALRMCTYVYARIRVYTHVALRRVA